jgi:hypothetical protein
MKPAPPFDCDVCGLRLDPAAMLGGFTCHPSCGPNPQPPDDGVFDAALRLLTNIGAIEIPPDYCRKCGRDYQPDGSCRHCDRATAP